MESERKLLGNSKLVMNKTGSTLEELRKHYTGKLTGDDQKTMNTNKTILATFLAKSNLDSLSNLTV